MKNNPTLPATPKDSNARGRWAEQLAENWLAAQGLTPCAQNYTRRLGEIDLVLRDEPNNTWVFVEVKYRGVNARVSGVDSITKAKQRKLYRTAELFLQRVRDQTSAARIDIVVITDTLNKQQQPTREAEFGHHCELIGTHELQWIQNAITQ